MISIVALLMLATCVSSLPQGGFGPGFTPNVQQNPIVQGQFPADFFYNTGPVPLTYSGVTTGVNNFNRIPQQLPYYGAPTRFVVPLTYSGAQPSNRYINSPFDAPTFYQKPLEQHGYVIQY